MSDELSTAAELVEIIADLNRCGENTGKAVEQLDATLERLIQQKIDKHIVGRQLPDAPINHCNA
jgi:hypothetical protein